LVNRWSVRLEGVVDLSPIARFNRFYGEQPIVLFDGTNRMQRFSQVPWTVVKQHSHGLCNTCVVRAWRDRRARATG
jgi:hypothetical protein